MLGFFPLTLFPMTVNILFHSTHEASSVALLPAALIIPVNKIGRRVRNSEHCSMLIVCFPFILHLLSVRRHSHSRDAFIRQPNDATCKTC